MKRPLSRSILQSDDSETLRNRSSEDLSGNFSEYFRQLEPGTLSGARQQLYNRLALEYLSYRFGEVDQKELRQQYSDIIKPLGGEQQAKQFIRDLETIVDAAIDKCLGRGRS